MPAGNHAACGFLYERLIFFDNTNHPCSHTSDARILLRSPSLSSLNALLTSKQEQIASLASQLHHPSRQEAGRALAAQREQLISLNAALENAEKEHADRKENVIRLHSAMEQLKRQLEDPVSEAIIDSFEVPISTIHAAVTDGTITLDIH